MTSGPLWTDLTGLGSYTSYKDQNIDSLANHFVEIEKKQKIKKKPRKIGLCGFLTCGLLGGGSKKDRAPRERPIITRTDLPDSNGNNNDEGLTKNWSRLSTRARKSFRNLRRGSQIEDLDQDQEKLPNKKDLTQAFLELRHKEDEYRNRQTYEPMLSDVPLYQDYDKSIKRRAKIRGGQSVDESENRRRTSEITARSNARVENFVQEIAGQGPSRVTWTDLPMVQAQNLHEGLTSLQKSLQEARFEIITSEASYYRSMSVLIKTFYYGSLFGGLSEDGAQQSFVVNPYDKHQLFSNILAVHVTSEHFLQNLESLLQRDVWLKEIADVILDLAKENSKNYIFYIQNQVYQTRALDKLNQNPLFVQELKLLQKRPECGFLDLHSFLMLPMQRVTRLRLLTSTMLHYTPQSDKAYWRGLIALGALDHLIQNCDAKKTEMEQKERMLQLCHRFEYKDDHKSMSTADRKLFKEGSLKLLTLSKLSQTSFRRTFSLRKNRRAMEATVFVFNDVILITKARLNERYFVEESCPLSSVQVFELGTPPGNCICCYLTDSPSNGNVPDSKPSVADLVKSDLETNPGKSTLKYSASVSLPKKGSRRDRTRSRTTSVSYEPYHHSPEPDSTANEYNEMASSFPFRLKITNESDPYSEPVIYDLQAASLSDRERWLDALSPKRYAVPADIDFSLWDCPQMICVKPYSGKQSDELDLREGDVLNVIVRVSDGWIKGMLQDGKRGWVPVSACEDVVDPTSRRMNMKNFNLMEQAKTAYQNHVNQERNGLFPRARESSRASKMIAT